MLATLSLVLNVARIQYHKYQKGQKGRKLHRLSGSYLEGMFEGSRRAGKGKGPESRRKRVCDFADAGRGPFGGCAALSDGQGKAARRNGRGQESSKRVYSIGRARAVVYV